MAPLAVFVLVLLCCSLVSFSLAQDDLTAAAAAASANRYIISLRPGTARHFTAQVAALNAKRSSILPQVSLLREIPAHDVMLAEIPDAAADPTVLSLLAQELGDDVLAIEPNHPVYAHSLYAQDVGELWHLDSISKPDFSSNNGKYEYDHLGQGVDVYVFDTGINSFHVDFGGRVKFFGSYSGSNCDDCNGHGTHVAGTVGGAIYGIAKNVTLHSVQVLGDSGVGDMFTVSMALYDVADAIKKTSVAVMSLGGENNLSIKTAAKYARGKGLLMAVSSGNSNLDACRFSPADSPDVITVSANTKKGTRADFSNYGSCVSIYAPGVAIKSTYIGSTTATQTLSGTSMAAPVIAGILAQMLEQNQFLTHEIAKSSLQQQSKSGFLETDAPAATSLVRAAPCTTYCKNTVVSFAVGQTVATYPTNGLTIEANGSVYAWLYYPENYSNRAFTLSLLQQVDGQYVTKNESSPTIPPLVVSSTAKLNDTIQFQVRRTANLTNALSITLFVQVPLKCYAGTDCNSNGNCKLDGTCDCFIGFYGSDCSGQTFTFLLKTGVMTGNAIFLATLAVMGCQAILAAKKNRVDELEPLLGREPRQVSDRI